MAHVNNASYTQAAYQSARNYSGTGTRKEEKAKETTASSKSWVSPNETTTKVTGSRTYGNPELSEEGMKYYQSLMKKYGHLDFVLVSSDKKQEAEMMKGSFANPGKMTVLIDTDKIEQMARDEKFRAKYENILNNAKSGLSQMQAQLGSSGAKVNAFGMTFGKDGRASFFATIDKSMKAQRDKITRRTAEKAKTKKEEARKAEKEKRNERMDKTDKTDGRGHGEEEDTITLTADSPEELLRKIQDYYQQGMFNNVRTEEEMMVGSRVDFGV